jgi:O-antigen/teichoic acid export membrane protein
MLPVNALCVIQNTIFARQFRFATLSRINFSSAALAGVAAIVMAWSGFGVWSLVAQRLVQVTVKAALLWWRGEWRLQGEFDKSALGAMSGFSFRLMGTDIISYLYNNISQLFIGKIYSASTLGYYNQAQKLKELPVTSVVQSFQSVTYPALANVKDNKQKFADSYLRVLAITAAVIAPIMVGMVAVADDMFMLLLGERWMPTVPYFKILSLAGLFYPISMIAYNVLKVAGDGKVILSLEVVKKVIMTIILAVTIPHSVVAIAWGMLVMAVVEFALNAAFSLRFAQLRVSDLFFTLLPIALLTVVMFVAVRAVGLYTAHLQIFVRFVVQIAVGVFVYCAGAIIFRVNFVKDILQSLQRIVSKR